MAGQETLYSDFSIDTILKRNQFARTGEGLDEASAKLLVSVKNFTGFLTKSPSTRLLMQYFFRSGTFYGVENSSLISDWLSANLKFQRYTSVNKLKKNFNVINVQKSGSFMIGNTFYGTDFEESLESVCRCIVEFFTLLPSNIRTTQELMAKFYTDKVFTAFALLAVYLDVRIVDVVNLLDMTLPDLQGAYAKCNLLLCPADESAYLLYDSTTGCGSYYSKEAAVQLISSEHLKKMKEF